MTNAAATVTQTAECQRVCKYHQQPAAERRWTKPCSSVRRRDKALADQELLLILRTSTCAKVKQRHNQPTDLGSCKQHNLFQDQVRCSSA